SRLARPRRRRANLAGRRQARRTRRRAAGAVSGGVTGTGTGMTERCRRCVAGRARRGAVAGVRRRARRGGRAAHRSAGAGARAVARVAPGAGIAIVAGGARGLVELVANAVAAAPEPGVAGRALRTVVDKRLLLFADLG